MLQDEQQIAKKLDTLLAPYAVKHSTYKGRAMSEPADFYRTPYQKDRDRVLHSKAFRRLKDKTQVFTPITGAHFRDRLTHSLEVSQIARSLARALAVNEDLAEVIALAHDLGHTPFGHAGEYALTECLKTHGLNFEHNEQSRRVASTLNLTFETLEGLQKHQTPYDQINNKFVNATLEAQIVNLADEIAYHNHDLDDALRSKVVTREEVQILDLWREADNGQDDYFKVISAIMKLMVKDILNQTARNIEKYNINTLEDVYSCEQKLVEFSPEFMPKVQQVRKFLYNLFYSSKAVKSQTQKGQEIIKFLFDFYLKNTAMLPQKYQAKIADGENPVIIVKDYIAGMTDSYARSKHKQYAMS